LLQQARDMRAMDQGGQGRDQVDAAVVLERSRPTPCASSFMRSPATSEISCACWRRPTNQGLVADEPEGEADQDWCEGREPRSPCRFPDGRGRDSPANVPGDIAAHGGPAPAAATSAREENIKLTLPGGRVANASLAGRDPTTDVAVLRFQPDGLPVATTA